MKPKRPNKVQVQLNKIAEEMKKPKANKAKLDKMIGKLLGMELQPEDFELLKAWEAERGRKVKNDLT